MYKILVATVPSDGHFNPLTGVAVYLKQQGHDVRWYTGPSYADRVAKLGIPFYPFTQAREINQDNLNEMLPERLQIKGALARVRFDIRHVFLDNVTGYFNDVRIIQETFDFDVLLVDAGMSACHLIQEKLHKPAVVFGIAPLLESSRDLPPYGLGLTPGNGLLGRLRDRLLRTVINNVIFGDAKAYYNELIRAHGLPYMNEMILNVAVRHTAIYLQSGVPGFEYPRSDIHPNVRFVGPLLPYKKPVKTPFAYADKARSYKKTILISQGTVDNKEPEKLIIPALEALKNEPYLLLVTTGGQHTAALQDRYPQNNIIIADFMDYDATLPHTDLFVSCGGYGSVLLSLTYGVPILAAGKHEGKNEIVARIGYFRLGINLKTEKPSQPQIARGVQNIQSSPIYYQNVTRLQQEFRHYDPNALSEQYIRQAVAKFQRRRTVAVEPE